MTVILVAGKFGGLHNALMLYVIVAEIESFGR